MKTHFIFLCQAIFLLCFAHAQSTQSYSSVSAQLSNIEEKIKKLDSQDPEKISLHYFLLKDYKKELEEINQTIHDQSFSSKENRVLTDYYNTLSWNLNDLEIIFSQKKEKIDYLFYAEAEKELMFNNPEEALYNVNRALQYNASQPEALLLKAKLVFAKQEYDECLKLVHTLFNKATLTEQEERDVYDFSTIFYDRIFKLGDSLVKADKGAYAIEMFTLLESFCKDMPSNYCNDDYYHGILRSQKGVYDSYIAIAEVARKRGNYKMEKKFLEYARQYLEENSELKEP